MKILIAVPSKGRANKQELNTFGWLKYTKYDYKYFVEPQDYDSYKRFIPESKLINIGNDNRGLWFVKKFIKKYAFSKGYELIFKLDDDVQAWRDPQNRGLGRNAPKVSKLDRCKRLFEPIIKNSIELAFSMPEIGGVSLMYGSDMREFDVNKIFIGINNRFQSSYLIRTELFVPEGIPDFIGTFEDFTTFINLIKKDYFVLRYGLTGQDVQPVGKNEGGVQNFNRKNAAIQEMSWILSKWPDVVFKKVEGKNWDFEPDFRKTEFIKTIKL